MKKQVSNRSDQFLTTIAVALGAFLLFLIQPLAARAILPGFGGVPAVWAASLACYQVLLFLGYLGAHLLRTRGGGREQAVVVTILVGAALLSLPALPRPSSGGGVMSLVSVLMLGVGPAFVVLAMGGPLVQAWSRGRGRGVYGLYAVSNAASLVALLGYPVVFERLFGVMDLSRIWSVLFVVQGVLLILLAWRRRGLRDSMAVSSIGLPVGTTVRNAGLAAVGVIMLNAVTTWLGQDVASVPLLWTGPLALYLLTWVVAFSGRLHLGARTATALTAGSAVLMVVLVTPGIVQDILPRIVLGLTALGASCLAVHGALHRRRPGAENLTGFYLGLAGGGAVGGVVSGLLAPFLGAGWTEMVLGFGGAAVLAGDLGLSSSTNSLRFRVLARAALGVLFGLLLLTVHQGREGQVLAHRDFHGLIRVFEEHADDPTEHRLVMNHGATRHGVQYIDPQRRRAVTAYFGPTTGGGLAFATCRSLVGDRGGLRVGIVGLGVGTLAAYGRVGDQVRFYELSPAVVSLARGELGDGLPGGGFSFLADCAAETDVVVGDARVSLAGELNRDPAGRRYDLLVIDAFSGDVVPVHLLTTEAFELYTRHLAAEGLIAVHVSSNWLDLRPVLYAWARDHQWRALTIANHADHGSDGALISTWVLLFRDIDTLRILRDHCTPLMQSGVIQVENRNDVQFGSLQAWTDDRSDLISILRARVDAR